MIRVLVVDDHPVVRHGLIAILRYEPGIEVVGDAADGEEALRLILERRPDVVLLDLRLPDGDGFTVCEHIKASRPSLPVVMITSGYPVEVGLAASLARPGGNVTGLTLYAGKEVFSKQVQLLTEARPGLRRIGVLWDYPPPDGPLGIREMQAAARALGVELELFTLQHAEDLQAALTTLGKSGIDTLFVTLGFVNLQPAAWAAIKGHVERHRAFVSFDSGRISEDSFATMIYSTRPGDHVRRAAWYVDRILKGARPGDLPIELPSRFELQLNLRIARQLGIEIPASLISRADQVFD